MVFITPGSNGRELWLMRGLGYLVDSTIADAKWTDAVFDLAGGREAGSNFISAALLFMGKSKIRNPHPEIWFELREGAGGENIYTRAPT